MTERAASVEDDSRPTDHAEEADDGRVGEAADGTTVRIGHDALELVLRVGDGVAPWMSWCGPPGGEELAHGVPLIQVHTVGRGRVPSSGRLADSALGADFRYVGHRSLPEARPGWTVVEVDAREPGGLVATVRVELPAGVAAVRVSLSLRHDGADAVVLQAIPTLVAAVPLRGGAGPAAEDLDLVHADADWLAESRWRRQPLRDAGLADVHPVLGNRGRARVAVRSQGTWSTGRALPVGALIDRTGTGGAVLWQIEHNGGWRWEVAETDRRVSVALSGPLDADHQWSTPLRPGEVVESVPVALAVGDDLTGAVAAMTAFRRADRRPHAADDRLPVVYNDFMNTVMADPSTTVLLPLVDAAAAAGADVYCVDAGWYDDAAGWWSSVGEWSPSRRRFPGGLEEVLDRIRAHGMVAGLWLEPEVVGVDSPVARQLPDEAFLRRHGQRVVEHERYHLDFRHPGAVAHVDAAVDRIVDGLGVQYLKLDYNIDPGAGTDVDAASAGDGLLGHARAVLRWLDDVRGRHPDLVLENCGSGGMRADWAMMRRMQLQSTSDQQDPLHYPPIAAVAPMHLLPEQAGNWAYPQPEMTEEEVAFTLVTGVLGRLYLSGFLDRMDAARMALVREAVAVHRALRPLIRHGMPFWPLGLEQRDLPWVALGMRAGAECAVSLWKRPGGAAEVDVPVPWIGDADTEAAVVFPSRLGGWRTSWDASSRCLRVRVDDPDRATARVVRLHPRR
ncbi:MAG: alpha-galactosidase [Dermatophilaceae bacterium]